MTTAIRSLVLFGILISSFAVPIAYGSGDHRLRHMPEEIVHLIEGFEFGRVSSEAFVAAVLETAGYQDPATRLLVYSELRSKKEKRFSEVLLLLGAHECEFSLDDSMINWGSHRPDFLPEESNTNRLCNSVIRDEEVMEAVIRAGDEQCQILFRMCHQDMLSRLLRKPPDEDVLIASLSRSRYGFLRTRAIIQMTKNRPSEKAVPALLKTLDDDYVYGNRDKIVLKERAAEILISLGKRDLVEQHLKKRRPATDVLDGGATGALPTEQFAKELQTKKTAVDKTVSVRTDAEISELAGRKNVIAAAIMVLIAGITVLLALEFARRRKQR